MKETKKKVEEAAKTTKEAIDKDKKEAKAMNMAKKKAQEEASQAKANHKARITKIRKLKALLKKSKTKVAVRGRKEWRPRVVSKTKSRLYFKIHGSVLSLTRAS